MNHLDKRTAIMQALWKKAMLVPEGVRISFKTEKEARKVRFDLYNAVKKVKADPSLDPDLHQAATGVGLSFDGPLTLVLAKKVLEEGLLEAAESLGIELETLRKAPENTFDAKINREAESSMERLLRIQAEADQKAAEEAAKPTEDKPGFRNPYASAMRNRKD